MDSYQPIKWEKRIYKIINALSTGKYLVCLISEIEYAFCYFCISSGTEIESSADASCFLIMGYDRYLSGNSRCLIFFIFISGTVISRTSKAVSSWNCVNRKNNSDLFFKVCGFDKNRRIISSKGFCTVCVCFNWSSVYISC